ncbi:MAG: Mrp/NBP35 family ATP-binding protein [Bdellovibrionales bacterium]|nr:Mrp/NBP35 family ATP-binding protein [Bdellovibrionales bacterium]
MSSNKSFSQKTAIEGVRHILVVGSGKGGVGKSTLSLNVSVALAKLNLKVGLLDGDLYGPSLPRLTGTLYLKPELNQDKKLLPLRRYGINLLSMGHLVEEESPLVWRGPMLFKAIEQFFRDVSWGDLDILVIDLPPGTGDVALTIAQKVPVSGGIVVSTPQNLSLVDTKKALNMFHQIEIPVLGVVENMSSYKESSGKDVSLFPKGQIDIYLKEKKIDKLAEISFHPHIALSSEAGVPFLESQVDSKEAQSFFQVARKIKSHLFSSN